MGSVAWLSLDPVNGRVDVYPQRVAAEIERAYAYAGRGEGSIFLGAHMQGARARRHLRVRKP